MARKRQSEITFQQHIADYLVREHKYGVLEQANLACTNATKVGEFPIPFPPLVEQEAIYIYLDEKLAELKRIITGIEPQIATLTAYRKSLIHECVTGQRRVTEADVTAALRVEPFLSKLH